MAFLQASFFSSVLAKEVALNAILPGQGRGPFPVFYLLHGLSDDHTTWMRRTRIEWYVRELPLIVVMPDGFRSFYTDHHEGPAHGRYIMEDVIGFAERAFPAVGRRRGRCIGGLSMGGYGSLRLALAHPGRFVSANSHSGALGLFERPLPHGGDPERRRIFGPRPKGGAHDPSALAKRLKRQGKRFPKLRLDCGLEDGLLEANRAFHRQLTKWKIPHEYEEFPGSHNWDYWDEQIRTALRFHARALKIAKGAAVKRLGG